MPKLKILDRLPDDVVPIFVSDPRIISLAQKVFATLDKYAAEFPHHQLGNSASPGHYWYVLNYASLIGRNEFKEDNHSLKLLMAAALLHDYQYPQARQQGDTKLHPRLAAEWIKGNLYLFKFNQQEIGIIANAVLHHDGNFGIPQTHFEECLFDADMAERTNLVNRVKQMLDEKSPLRRELAYKYPTIRGYAKLVVNRFRPIDDDNNYFFTPTARQLDSGRVAAYVDLCRLIIQLPEKKLSLLYPSLKFLTE
jgi:HD superfamily phosphodiesterase